MNKILIINGPNLNLLGQREVGIYGTVTLDEINKNLAAEAAKNQVELDFFQSNHEGEIVEKIQKAPDAFQLIIINPAAFTHYSIAIRDAIASIDIPVIEVHLSNICARESFREKSITASVCLGQISGFGPLSYQIALDAAIKLLKK
ncbi:type II 3-dehydroquinate dehydratase [Candidatus Oleimmundimicrobium sp.]|uniref:type II 3-dehydroquinate dehydratase n=1 Tax=Candidatus Oleimmundimicrobium sp. TaxID=3060597 RepID=UPI0027237A24|nr:type II 3-dehydroquinate dehydratase [Candidatus Oleimmundimicrobium sp.]MDO8886513.1 type II 3-dehydroquinate dehydratase [Candidatus Oleimmundimicrobium sp.]